jgi:hypothetical protein
VVIGDATTAEGRDHAFMWTEAGGMVHPILRHGRGCVERQDHERDNRARDTPNRRTPIANGRNHAADNAGGSVIQMAYGILRRRQAR